MPPDISSKNLRFEVLMDRRENKKQCTIHPLRNRSDFSIHYFDRGQTPLKPFISDILLHTDGAPLDDPDFHKNTTVQSIATIDCTWKNLAPALSRIEKPLPVLVKIPSSFVTAYPRKSKQEGLDPEGGLATIEALFIAAAFCGHWDETLLEYFYFKNDFLRLNSANWEKYSLEKIKKA